MTILAALLLAVQAGPYPGTRPLEETGDLADLMMDGLHRHVERKIRESAAGRMERWKTGAEGRRERLLKIIGAVDPRVPAHLERYGDDANPALVAETPRYRAWQVRWPVLEGVTGEGLLLEPAGKPVGGVLVLPDADHTPEQAAGLAPGIPRDRQRARRLAENGFRVLVPVLINRDFDVSGREGVAWTHQSHREWIYRQAFQMGRHVIGYEVQKAFAAADLLAGAGTLGIAGDGEGGLIALLAAALDARFDSALISGYFGPRENSWQEPLYRNVWSLLREFGDAELAAMMAPRKLLVEATPWPSVESPGKPPAGRRPGAAVGRLATPPLAAIQAEFGRIGALLGDGPVRSNVLMSAGDGLVRFAGWLDIEGLRADDAAPSDLRRAFDPRERQRRQVRELEGHVQKLLQDSARTRDAALLETTSLVKGLGSRGERFRMSSLATRPPEVFAAEMERHRTRFWEEALGKLDEPLPAPNARSRKVYDREKWAGWDVTLECAPEFFAWGLLLVPKDIAPGERRPVVVCQHGRNGLPKETVEGGHWAYHDFAAKLVERGYIVFAPHNPYRGEDRYRLLSRKGNLVKTSLFSYILHQHSQILAWLKSLPVVDGAKIGFYGLSYGGETAVRVPPLLTDYALSICSGDFNDWARKVASIDNDYSFMYSIEWEMPYFDLGNTFNYAEMAYLMVPRPFMVERGHHDGVAPDEWVAAEYAKVRWLYTQLGLADRTAIEFSNGGHTIYAAGTFEFLKRHLGR